MEVKSLLGLVKNQESSASSAIYPAYELKTDVVTVIFQKSSDSSETFGLAGSFHLMSI